MGALVLGTSDILEVVKEMDLCVYAYKTYAESVLLLVYCEKNLSCMRSCFICVF